MRKKKKMQVENGRLLDFLQIILYSFVKPSDRMMWNGKSPRVLIQAPLNFLRLQFSNCNY